VRVINAPPPDSKAQVFPYDFKNGPDDWELGAGVWTRVPWEGGYALRGEGHGFVRLTAHSGDVTSVSFGFRLDSAESVLRANVLESVEGPQQRYVISLGPQGIEIGRQEGSTVNSLARVTGAVAPGTPHDAEILVGGGSIDVFLDGMGALGVDHSAPPPPGYVSFESMDRSVAYVQNVKVQIGPESAPHPRAPRPR
jgi:hypothetical protein